jgi:tetratricopeptide (TPR) repeat protein
LLERHGASAILGLLDGLKRSKGRLDPAFEAVTGGNLAAFEASWRVWLKTRRFETRDGAKKPAIAFGKNRAAVDDDDPARPDGEAGRFARLGDLLYRRGHRAAAAIEYERSVDRAGYGYPGLVHRLAACLIASKALDKAGTVLAKSAARSPDDPRTQVLLGRLALEAKRHEEALAAYGRANAINPFDPEVHEGMRLAAEALKQPEVVKREVLALNRLRGQAAVKAPKSDPKKQGFLSLSSSPWADVIIDDRPLGRATPLTDFPLTAGKYRLTLRNSALSLEHHLDLQIRLGQTTTLKLDLRTNK